MPLLAWTVKCFTRAMYAAKQRIRDARSGACGFAQRSVGSGSRYSTNTVRLASPMSVVGFSVRARADLGGAIEIVPVINGRDLSDMIHAFERDHGMETRGLVRWAHPGFLSIWPLGPSFPRAVAVTRSRAEGATARLQLWRVGLLAADGADHGRRRTRSLDRIRAAVSEGTRLQRLRAIHLRRRPISRSVGGTQRVGVKAACASRLAAHHSNRRRTDRCLPALGETLRKSPPAPRPGVPQLGTVEVMDGARPYDSDPADQGRARHDRCASGAGGPGRRHLSARLGSAECVRVVWKSPRQGLAALRRAQEHAQSRGLDRLSPKDIDAEIKAARAARGRRG